MPWIFGPEFPGHPKKVEMKELCNLDIPAHAIAFKARTEAFLIKQVATFGRPSPCQPEQCLHGTSRSKIRSPCFGLPDIIVL